MEGIVPYIEKFSYIGLYVIIILFSFVLPFSKTLVILLSGVLASEDVGNLGLFIVVGLLGLVSADSIYFSIGYFGGERIRSLRYFSTGNRRQKLLDAEKRFMKHGWFAVFSARFTPFIRSLIFVVAGMTGMSWVKFLHADVLSALILVPVASLLGYFFAEKRAVIYAYVSEGEYGLAAILAGILVVLLFGPGMKKKKK